MAQFPNTTAADGIWTLKKVRRAILGGNWPPLILPPQPLLSLPSSEGQLILGNYGFEAWKVGYGDGLQDTFSFVVPSGVQKIRCILIGGGGGSTSGFNVDSAGGGAGIEFFADVTPGETLTCQIGMAGDGTVLATEHGDGGDSVLKRGATVLATASGGPKSVNTGTIPRATATGSGDVTVISIGHGGQGGGSGTRTQTDVNALSSEVNLSGATAHAGATSQWSGTGGNGLGFGGGGGVYAATPGSGGIYGYAGNVINANGAPEDTPAGGPVRGKPNPADNPNDSAGGAGGSFGAGALEGFAASSGAGGLVRIWWANSSGDATWIDIGGNYVE